MKSICGEKTVIAEVVAASAVVISWFYCGFGVFLSLYSFFEYWIGRYMYLPIGANHLFLWLSYLGAFISVASALALAHAIGDTKLTMVISTFLSLISLAIFVVSVVFGCQILSAGFLIFPICSTIATLFKKRLEGKAGK